ncbi:hypothetical protein ZIOFF_018302 [Zingiber officinale]|uniref:Uncharacterized protein n=1 Tax=Zingiber officinale TaxID=94328 RepID=A0A8J5LIQ8_ZINOF|nr:hypothetical protein ZIOFF_018302 [Zingiber officinale]
MRSGSTEPSLPWLRQQTLSSALAPAAIVSARHRPSSPLLGVADPNLVSFVLPTVAFQLCPRSSESGSLSGSSVRSSNPSLGAPLPCPSFTVGSSFSHLLQCTNRGASEIGEFCFDYFFLIQLVDSNLIRAQLTLEVLASALSRELATLQRCLVLSLYSLANILFWAGNPFDCEPSAIILDLDIENLKVTKEGLVADVTVRERVTDGEVCRSRGHVDSIVTVTIKDDHVYYYTFGSKGLAISGERKRA